MDTRICVGILGAGNIARRMADTAGFVAETRAYAVASRELAKAERFAGEHGVERAYGSYEALLADPRVELVYVALPHSHHAFWTQAALEAGKHVLTEKAFTENASQARTLFALAERKGLFCGEAMWSRFVPGARVLRELGEGGMIGRVTGLRGELGFPSWHIPRIREPGLAGGALLDIGVYTLAFATVVLGTAPVSCRGQLMMGETGVDMQDSLLLRYPGDKTALLFNSCVAAAENRGVIYGTEGFAMVRELFCYPYIDLFGPDGVLRKRVNTPVEYTGFEYELRAACAAIRAGRLECPEMTHQETLRILSLTDELRAGAGFRFPDEN